jgi:hypothetical protein
MLLSTYHNADRQHETRHSPFPRGTGERWWGGGGRRDSCWLTTLLLTRKSPLELLLLLLQLLQLLLLLLLDRGATRPMVHNGTRCDVAQATSKQTRGPTDT